MLHALEYSIGIYAALLGCMFFFQRRLMYYPNKVVSLPAAYGLLAAKEVFFTTLDGTKLHAWTHDARAGYPTILYFHGNAEHLGWRAPKFAAFIDAGFGLIAVSYHGFGKSAGRPSEMNVYAAARSAIDYALDTSNLPQDRLIYFGESLGSGVAVQMASERPPGLLVLEAAYTSVETRSAQLYPFVIGVRKLVRDKYDSLSKIKNVHAPLLMLHGEKDATIPVAHGRALFAAANDPKDLIVYPQVNHVDYTNEQITEPLLAAAKNYKLIQP